MDGRVQLLRLMHSLLEEFGKTNDASLSSVYEGDDITAQLMVHWGDKSYIIGTSEMYEISMGSQNGH